MLNRFFLSLIRSYRHLTNRRYGWFGNYSSWQEAGKICTGYNASAVFEKVRAATLKVKNGEAVYEQDGMLHDKIGYSWPLLAHLLWIASKKENTLSVLDFGGSLGSSYFQNRKYLSHINVKWSVVEQKEFVDTGKKEIADNRLQFFYAIDEAIKERGMPDVLLIACVIPYIEDPYALLEEIMSKKIPYLILDNTYFNPKAGDRLTIQKVPPVYYDASYPAWFLDYEKVKAVLSKKYEILEEYENEQFLYFYGEKINYRGLFFRYAYS